MHRLNPQQTEQLQDAYAAIGTGNLLEAMDALGKIPAECRDHPAVLVTRLSLCEAAKDWANCLEVVEKLIAQLPDNPMHWVQRSLYLRELGRLEEARAKLLPAAEKYPKFWMVPYHLAGFACRLGSLGEARQRLNAALDLVDADSIKTKALGDADFQPLWPEIRML